MNIRVAIAAALTACAGTAFAAAATDQAEKDKATILAAERHMCGLTNMSQSVDTTIGYYDKDVVQFDIMPEVFVGQEAVRKSLAAQYGPLRNMRCQMQDVHVGLEGDLAYVFSVQAFEAETGSTGPYGNAELHEPSTAPAKPFKFKMAWRQTDIWRKKGGKWTMIHQHSSFPLDVKTGKANMVMREIKE